MKLSVVIVAYQAASFVKPCLDSVLAQADGDVEIILFDNASSDGTAETVAGCFPAVRLIRSRSNVGAAAARNLAIDGATGEWVLTLDADAVLREDFVVSLRKILEGLCGEPRVGGLAPKILCADKKHIYSAGGRLTFLRRFYDGGCGQADRGQFDGQGEVFGACSATAVYRRAMLEDLKFRDGFYFDERFFVMAEDMDLAWRSRRRGWRVRFCPSCVSYHQGNGSAMQGRERSFLSIRNRFLMMFGNERRLYFLLFFVPFFLYEVLRFGYLARRGYGAVYLAAVRSAACLLKTKRRREA